VSILQNIYYANQAIYVETSPMDSNLVKTLAPIGVLRASINLGNPLLAKRDPSTGQPVGVSIDLATEFAKVLNVPVELLVFDKASESVEAVKSGRADLGFFAIDPLRGQDIAFTSAYVLIEGCYMVRADSPLMSNEEVDRAGMRVTVGAGSAYDLFLSRELKNAQIERAESSQAVVQTFMAQGHDVAAGVKQQLQTDALNLPSLRLLPGRFMVIEQAMGLPKSRGSDAAMALRQFVEQMKASGFVAQSLKRHGIEGAAVAP
jgi:polar amino acid transport system substrate-binding protein